MALTYFFVILFVAAMIYLGYVGMRRTKTMGDFFLAGRNIGPWLSAFSYGTTYFSAVIFVGFAGKIGWGFGIKSLWISFGNMFLGAFLAWVILAKRTREMTSRLNVMTMPEFLEARYKSPGLKPLAAFVIFLFLIPYSASVYQGLGYLFRESLRMPFELSLLFIAILTGIYLVMGGYHAINIADMIQGVIMIGGALLMAFFLVHAIGGFGNATKLQQERYWQHFAKPGMEIKAPTPQTEPVPASQPEDVQPATPAKPKPNPPKPFMLLCLVLLTSLGPWGLPQMVQKFYAIKNKTIILKATIVTTIFAAIIAFVAYYCGSLTHVFFNPGSELDVQTAHGVIKAMKLPMVQGAKPSPDFDALVPIMLQNYCPRWLNTVILLLILSASMSTLSSLVLVSSSAIAIDLYLGRSPDEKKKLQALVLMRVLCAVFVFASVLIALGKVMFIVNLMSIAWGAVAGCFLAPYLYGLFWRRGTKIAVYVSMICALLITFVGYMILGVNMSPVFGTASMLAPLVIFPLVCLFTEALPREHLDVVFGNGEKKE